MTELCSAGRIVFAREPDEVWPTAENPCSEPAGKQGLSMVTPGIGYYTVHARLCDMHQAESLTHFHVVNEPFTPEGPTYQVRAKRFGDLWELTIPDVGVTQCGGYLGDAWEMVIDYIFVQTGVRVREEQIRLAIEGDPDDYLKRPEVSE